MDRLSVVVLAGGEGTRIKPVIGEKAKILAKIEGIAFIDYLVTWLKVSLKNISFQLVFATGCYHEQVEKYIIDFKIEGELVRETVPMGTLGAAANALMRLEADDTLIVNGDTLFECNLNEAYSEYIINTDIPLLLTQEIDVNERYGGYIINSIDERLEKSDKTASLISLGAVFCKSNMVIDYYKRSIKKGVKKPMMDRDFLELVRPKTMTIGKNNKFIDIGVPESYKMAQALVPQIKDYYA